MSHTATAPTTTTVTLDMAKDAHRQVQAVSHVEARSLAERIDTLSSRRFCDTGRLDNSFIYAVRIYANAGCPDMIRLDRYVAGRLTDGQRDRPADWL